MDPSPEELRQRLAQVDANGYGPLTETQVRVFERRHGVELPREYRQCLLSVSNGAPGIFRLGELDAGCGITTWQEGDGFVGRLAVPFPHSAEWNDLAGMPSDDFDDADPAACAEWELARAPFEARYWGPLDGAIPIAHVGCGTRHWLVVSGPGRGHVWEDDRANYQGLYPLSNDDGTPMDYRQWLAWQVSSEPSA